MNSRMLLSFILLLNCLPVTLQAAEPIQKNKRNLVTDEPRRKKGKPEAAAEYVPTIRPTDGQHLALSMGKLTHETWEGPFVIWALGSSYTNMLGKGEFWKQEIPKRFPNAPPIVFRKMVGNSCPWQYLQGWARHLVVPDQPDLVIVYTIGKPADLDNLLAELRTQTTSDIIVPSIHWRERDSKLWGTSENAVDQDVAAVRKVCHKYGVEFVENRRDWAGYLKANKLPLDALLKDAVHQSEYGAQIINRNMLAHFRRPKKYSYEPDERQRLVVSTTITKTGSIKAQFVGTRIDLHGKTSPNGGTFKVLIDGKPANQNESFLMTYVQPDAKNSRKRFGKSPTVPRDAAPHGITLGNEGDKITPQTWTIVMTSDKGDYQLTGDRTGADGEGNAFNHFVSDSGQIVIEPDLWRRAERNRTGDRFTFDVKRAVMNEISFDGKPNAKFSVRAAQMLTNDEHTIELVPIKKGPTAFSHLEAFQPPFQTAR